VRIDHFRGFAGYWAVPAGAKTAVGGRWLPGPGRELFDALAAALGSLPLVAEDLGVITPDVEALRDGLGLPGMAILQFAFSPSLRSSFVPYRHRANLVVYTGTHDNNTTLGWFLGEATDGEREYLRRYLDTDAREVHWDLIRAALASVADLAVVPHQDLAGLGGDCRMNTPSTAEGNWRFRLTGWMLDPGLQRRLADLVWLYGRSEATRPKPAAED
jgi:4-alpha-glucanotransferase